MTPELLAADPEWPYSKAKTAVLAAAAGVIRERGPRSATLKNIANRVGITEPAIFRHFEGVDGLFAGLFHTVERVYSRITAVYESDLPGWERLRHSVLAMVDILADGKDLAYVILYARQVFGGYPDLRERLDELESSDRAHFLECVRDAMARKEIRDDVSGESVALAVFGMAHVTVAEWIVAGFSFDLKQVIRARMEDLEKIVLLPAKERKTGSRKKTA